MSLIKPSSVASHLKIPTSLVSEKLKMTTKSILQLDQQVAPAPTQMLEMAMDLDQQQTYCVQGVPHQSQHVERSASVPIVKKVVISGPCLRSGFPRA